MCRQESVCLVFTHTIIDRVPFSTIYIYMYIALGVLCYFALFVCLTLLASFFLPSHLSFKNMYMYMYATMYIQRELGCNSAMCRVHRVHRSCSISVVNNKQQQTFTPSLLFTQCACS